MVQIDRKIELAVKSKYGLNAEEYASGTNLKTGMREISFDIFREDGTRFVVDGRYNPETDKVETSEREYIEYK